MEKMELGELLKNNPYPGRGIVLGLAPGGHQAFAAYFIMGRSENSRNRVFKQERGRLYTQAADPAKLSDPSLIIYNAMRRVGEHLIVTNGDQTDTIATALKCGGSFEGALRTRTYEPDAPNYTPRISGMLSLGFDGFDYRLSILKHGGGQAVQRFFYEYNYPQPGVGHFIHTYGPGALPSLLPSFGGEPVPVALPATARELANEMWATLNANNKVALAVRSVSLEGGEETLIRNKYEEK